MHSTFVLQGQVNVACFTPLVICISCKPPCLCDQFSQVAHWCRLLPQTACLGITPHNMLPAANSIRWHTVTAPWCAAKEMRMCTLSRRAAVLHHQQTCLPFPWQCNTAMQHCQTISPTKAQLPACHEAAHTVSGCTRTLQEACAQLSVLTGMCHMHSAKGQQRLGCPPCICCI